MGVDRQRATDSALLRATRRDPAAFGLLYERHVEVVVGYLTRETGSRGVALELTAETFARALASAHRFRPPADGSARPWLFGIAGNLLRSYRRSNSVEARARTRLGILAETTFTGDPGSAADEVGTWENDRVRAAIDQLPSEQRLAIELRIGRDLPYSEIADQLSCTQGAARTRVSRGLATLRIELLKSR